MKRWEYSTGERECGTYFSRKKIADPFTFNKMRRISNNGRIP